MIFLETPRLILRSVAPADADGIYDYRNHPRCARYQRGQVRELAGIAALLERHKDDVISSETAFMAAVVLKESGKLAGEITVMPSGGTFSLGYTISYQHHRKGYAYEALTALLSLLHGRYPEWDFISFTDPENEPSMALLRKLGYRDMGYAPAKASQVFGKWINPATEAEIALAVK